MLYNSAQHHTAESCGLQEANISMPAVAGHHIDNSIAAAAAAGALQGTGLQQLQHQQHGHGSFSNTSIQDRHSGVQTSDLALSGTAEHRVADVDPVSPMQDRSAPAGPSYKCSINTGTSRCCTSDIGCRSTATSTCCRGSSTGSRD
jgi:hypothetical protein